MTPPRQVCLAALATVDAWHRANDHHTPTPISLAGYHQALDQLATALHACFGPLPVGHHGGRRYPRDNELDDYTNEWEDE